MGLHMTKSLHHLTENESQFGVDRKNRMQVWYAALETDAQL